MELIHHRVNTRVELERLKAGLGAEIDLRSKQGQIILSHDPFQGGELLENFLGMWSSSSNRGVLILNTKEDGLEERALERLHHHGVENYFFLDVQIPTLIKLVTTRKLRRIAVRHSAFEPVEGVRIFIDKVEWVWIDYLQGVLPDLRVISELKQYFKLCFVSPELVGLPTSDIDGFRPYRSWIDAVCTKHPELWEA